MKILVVEDDVLVSEALAAILTNQNYAVETAADGETAWDLINTYDYDLLLLDVMLPRLDGISLCRQIRSLGLQMPILLLTGRDSSHDKAVGLNAGADDYVVKPFDEEELLARIHALFRRGTVSSQPILESGELRLDPSSCEVSYNREMLTLTPKEYALLELFMRNSKRVFSCGMILEHLWSYEETPGEEAVRTHIKGLRHKLKAAGAPNDLIETVYGIGYRLKAVSQEADKGQTKKSKKQAANSNSEQKAVLAVGEIWQKFQGRVLEQVDVLLRAADAVNNNTLNSELRASAKKEAHTLAGSLGTFGFADGSKIARKIENILLKETKLTANDRKKLASLVQELKQEIAVNSQSSQESADLSQDTIPLILIVDSEPSIITEITEEVNNWDIIKVTFASDINTARLKVYQEHPSAVLLDPSISTNGADSLSLVADLKQCKPPIPVIVFTEQTDFANRLQIARSGGDTFLHKPLPAAQVLSTVMRVLQQSNNAEANILAVDDDPNILAILQTLLVPWGLKVHTLDNPKRFWETLEATKPDLLILDVVMPEVSGIELCQVVRNDPDWNDLPILFLTAHNDATTLNQVFTSGADDFVSKPLVGPELVTRIINRLERNKLRRRMVKTNHRINDTLKTLQRTNQDLEMRVAERTAELVQANQKLQLELEERLRSQEALRNSQALFGGIISIADDAIISIDSQQNITLFNSGAEKIFGYSASEVLGQSLDILIPKRYIKAHKNHVDEFGKSPNQARRMAERQEIYARRKDGSEFPAEASISKLTQDSDIVYTVYLQDISDRKQIERMKDEFVSVVSHELRTPLTSIHGSLGMLASGLIKPDSEQGKRLLQIATDSTERLVRLINDILDIERIESGKVRMEKQSCNVADVIDEAVNIMQTIAASSKVTLSISNLSINIWADPDRIIQTLTNLLSNAIKFSKPESTVWLIAQQQDSEVLFTVRDTGRGIPEDKLESIFERFQQVDASDSRKQDGTGLGLAICKSIVQQHDGRIWVESVLGEGSAFYFTVPVSKSLPSQQREIDFYSQNASVLICDDDAGIRNDLKTLLEERGYRVLTVDSGEAAITAASELRPDVILLDLIMPGMNGWEVMAVLKQKKDTQDIPIIICSICTPASHNQLDERQAGRLSHDFAQWVCKPVEDNSLLRSLSQVLAHTSTRVRVLVVEDDDNLAQLLIALLQQHGIETFLAQTGREAIRQSQEIHPDLIILDLVLPEYDGFDVVEWLQQHNRLYNIPLLIYSARDLNDSERTKLQLGHTEFLTKGRVSTQEFEQKVMELIGRITQNRGGKNNDN